MINNNKPLSKKIKSKMFLANKKSIAVNSNKFLPKKIKRVMNRKKFFDSLTFLTWQEGLLNAKRH